MPEGSKTEGGSDNSVSGSLTSHLLPMNMKDDGERRRGHEWIRTRPAGLESKMGSSGQPILLKANFAKLERMSEAENPSAVLIYQYHVSFEPPVDSKSIRHRLLQEEAKALGVIEPIFDGMILYLPSQLPFNKILKLHPNTGEEIQVKLTLAAKLIPTDPQCITFFNVTNRRVQEQLGLVQINRHFYDCQLSVSIPEHKMNVWPGFTSSVGHGEKSLLMNMDVVHKLLRQDSALDYILACLGAYGRQGKEEAYKDLVGTSVLTRYNNKLYQVDEILWDKHPESTTFDKRDGRRLNLCEYMEEEYGLQVQVRDQPLLLSRAKRRGLDGNAKADILLIPELCFMTGLSERMRADKEVMRDLARRTRLTPQDRLERTEALLSSIHSNPAVAEILNSWALELDTSLVRIRARILPPENLYLGNERETKFSAGKAEWSRECAGKRLIMAKDLEEGKWALIFPAGQCRLLCERLYKTMEQEGGRLGMAVALPVLKELDSDGADDYATAIRESVNKERVSLVVVCVPNDFKGRYDAVKKVACRECPVPSQVVLAETLRRENILCSIVQKILIQINCKMGGAAWSLKIPMNRIMVVGYDSYTDSSMKGQAVGAGVFSLKDDLSRWFSIAELHQDPKKESENIATFFKKALAKYAQMNGHLPDRLFFFRCGVGEGDIPFVYKTELGLVKKAIQEIYGKGVEEDGAIKLAFLIVNKKIKHRFFAESPGKPGNFQNPPPGTVVDSVLTREERYDFFLVPQSVSEGTVTPVAYNVIYDGSGLSPDQMQRLCFKLSHLYYNWQGTIRVPAPCMYAYKLAFLTSQSIHAPAHQSLQDRLYFL